MLRLLFIIATCILCATQNTGLEKVTDQDLLNLIKTEKYVVVLFSKFYYLFVINKVITETNYENDYDIKYYSL